MTPVVLTSLTASLTFNLLNFTSQLITMATHLPDRRADAFLAANIGM